MKYQVIAILRGSPEDHKVYSPKYDDRAKAESDLAEIRRVQMRNRGGVVTNLDWLAARDENIIGAHIVEIGEPRAA